MIYATLHLLGQSYYSYSGSEQTLLREMSGYHNTGTLKHGLFQKQSLNVGNTGMQHTVT